jgi:hypothetical protein
VTPANDSTALDWVTLGIALAGLVLGIVNATVQVFSWRLNRAKIVVEISTAIAVSIPGLDPRELYVSVTVRNAGHRPATIAAGRFEVPSGAGGGGNAPLIDNPPVMLASLPKRLEEGEETILFASITALRDVVRRAGMIRRVTISTGSGKNVTRELPRALRSLLGG